MKKLSRFIALPLAMLITAALAGGCQSAAPTPTPGAAEQPGEQQAEEQANQETAGNDTFIFAQGADPRGLDPALVDDGESAMVMANVYEGLLAYADETTDLVPSLAQSWDVSEDGLVYTFYLQQGVQFHDGTPFNAEAVKFNIDRQLPPNDTSAMPYAEFTFGSVEKVDVIDEYTVQLTLKQPNTALLANLAMTMAAPIVSPSAIQNSPEGNVMEHPVGTGPFVFEKWDKGIAVTLTRNENYWSEKAKLQTLIIKITPENATRASEMMTGTINAMNGIDATNVQPLKDKGAMIFEAPGMNVNYMAFYTPRAPFDDRRVREALVRAINVDELVQTLYQGYSQVANSVLPSFVPGYNPDAKPYPYDPEKAKALLAEAGVPDLTLKMITYTNPRPYNSATGAKLAEAIQGYFSKIGVTATIDQYDWTTYKEKVIQGEGDICFYGWNGDNGDPDNFMNLLSDQNPAMNVAMYNNPEYNELISRGIFLPNGEERNAVYHQLEEIVATEAPWLPISHSTQLAAYGANVHNFIVHPTGGTVYFKKVYMD